MVLFDEISIYILSKFILLLFCEHQHVSISKESIIQDVCFLAYVVQKLDYGC